MAVGYPDNRYQISRKPGDVLWVTGTRFECTILMIDGPRPITELSRSGKARSESATTGPSSASDWPKLLVQ